MKSTKYEVAFQVIVDGGKLQEAGTIGSIGTANDYNPNEVKNTITKLYRQKYPSSAIAVIILGQPRKLETEAEYHEAARKFVRLNDEEV